MMHKAESIKYKAGNGLKAKSRKQKACLKIGKLHSVRAFCFQLLAFRFAYAFSFVLLAFSFQSCSFNPNLQGKGEAYVQGIWQQDSSAVQQKLVTAANYHIKFDCDSFYLQVNNVTRVNPGNDTCLKNGRWTEYMRGTYYHRHDTLLMKGQFCNPDYSLKAKAGCFRAGPYSEWFKVRKIADTLIELSGPSNVIPINLRRLKLTTCTPKPL